MESEWRLTEEGKKVYPGHEAQEIIDMLGEDIRYDLRCIALPDGTTAAEALRIAVDALPDEGGVWPDYPDTERAIPYEMIGRALRSLLGDEAAP